MLTHLATRTQQPRSTRPAGGGEVAPSWLVGVRYEARCRQRLGSRDPLELAPCTCGPVGGLSVWDRWVAGGRLIKCQTSRVVKTAQTSLDRSGTCPLWCLRGRGGHKTGPRVPSSRARSRREARNSNTLQRATVAALASPEVQASSPRFLQSHLGCMRLLHRWQCQPHL